MKSTKPRKRAAHLLEAWKNRTQIDPGTGLPRPWRWVAERVFGCTERQIMRWFDADTPAPPSPRITQIEHLTDGAVRADDWFTIGDAGVDSGDLARAPRPAPKGGGRGQTGAKKPTQEPRAHVGARRAAAREES